MRGAIRTLMLGAAFIVATTAMPASADEATISLTESSTFSPSTVSIAVGDSVTFVWEGGFHNVLFADGQGSGDPTGDAGTRWTRTFGAAGTYGFVCQVHESSMTGTVTVVEGDAGGAEDPAEGSEEPVADQQSQGDQPASTYPYTGPESALLPGLGGLLLALGGTGLVIRRRGRRRP